MKMFPREVIVCAILIGVVASITSIDASSSTANGRNFKENDILRDEDHAGVGKHRTPNNRAVSPLDVNNNGETNDSDDADASVGRFIDSDVKRFNDDEDNDDDDDGDEDGAADTDADDSETDEASIEASSVNQLSLKDQVHLLTRQLSALTRRQRADYKSLEQHVRKSARKATKQFVDELDVRHELEQLRHEVKALKSAAATAATTATAASGSSKERLAIDWFTQAIAEIRGELAELQEASSNTSRHLQQRNQCAEDITELRDDFAKLKLEFGAMRMRQETIDQAIKDLQAETIQRDEDFRRSQSHTHKGTGDDTDYIIEPEADHRMRHQRYIRQQIHDLDVAQKVMKRHINELQHHHIGDRLHNLETEQKRLANANFNVSRQVASLDHLHGSMLELLEDIEGIQNKFDKTIPDIKREISKFEFNAAQLASEQSLLREEGHNAAKSIQALAVSVSTLQDEKVGLRDLQATVDELKHNVTKLRAGANSHRHMFHKRIEKIEADSKLNTSAQAHVTTEIQMASRLVKQLESVEEQYESIINKLPTDCSRIEQNTTGLFMIAPGGQQHPILAHCIGDWTTIQRRHDGSVDFNRSWDEYGHGFGTPSGEYWIGNTVLSHLTADNCTSLKIIMQDIYDNTWEAVYSDFVVGAREDGYRLSISGYSGNASDAFDYQNHMQFSAIDVDRDISNTHCAGNYEGGWWFSHCQHANLNGRYNLGLTWFDASRNEWIAVKSSHMMVSKRGNCALPYTIVPEEASSRSATATTTTTPSSRPNV